MIQIPRELLLVLMLAASVSLPLLASKTVIGQTPESMPSSSPSAAPTSPFDLKMREQQLEIDSLESQLVLAQRELQTLRGEIELDLARYDAWLKFAAVVSVFLGIAGVAGIVQGYEKLRAKLMDSLGERLSQHVNAELAERFGRIDPTKVRVHIPARELEQERRWLERMGFQDVQSYDELDGVYLEGCVVVRIASRDDPRLLHLHSLLRDRVQRREDVGFVVYYSGQGRLEGLEGLHPLLTFANSAVTLGNTVLTVARLVRQ